ncbi:SWIM zinc finger family protein [Paenibacillus sp. y28]|uniref:SWIM zinc finger family protein n=1 Tax=Paenibacillus sp. y28 TaxID=3129110 RepID=UPI003019C981
MVTSIEELHKHFSPEIIRRGQRYFDQNAVSHMWIGDEGYVHGVVQGSDRYKVKLHPVNLSLSTCTCSYAVNCKHMVAVIMALQHTQDWGKKETAALKQTAAALDLASDSTSSPLPAQSLKASTRKTKARTGPLEHEALHQWELFFEQHFTKKHYNRIGDHGTFMQRMKKSLFPYAEMWDPNRKQVFALMIVLFVLKKAEQAYLSEGYYAQYYKQQYMALVQKAMQEMVACTPLLEEAVFQESYKDLQQETAELLTKYAFPTQESPVSWLFVYRYLWTRLLRHPSVVQREKTRLQKQIGAGSAASKKNTTFFNDCVRLALIHFSILEGQDEHALECLNTELSRKEPMYILHYFDSFYASHNWDRLRFWAERTSSFFWNRADLGDLYLQYWDELLKQGACDRGEWSRVMSKMLPQSYAHYTNYLLSNQMYRHWIDLHITYGIMPKVTAAEMKQVEKHNPELLLPLYHQAVDYCIGHKNRDAYKEAVRYMKKLKTVYSKLKQSVQWERYCQWICSRYSRLRALQEEMKRGKLIS